MISALLLLLSLPAGAQSGPVPVAGSVVRSKEWVVRRGKSKEEEFIGDVRYDSAGMRLTADWALYRHAQDDWQARGNIRARKEFDDGSVLETGGAGASYEQATQKGTLAPAKGERIRIVRTTLLRAPEHGEGDFLAWAGQRSFVLSGRARGWGPAGEFWADKADYALAPTRSLALTGERPLLHIYDGGADAVLNADLVHDVETPRRADADGRALGWIITQSTVTRAGDPPRCVRDSRDGMPGPDARVTALLADSKIWEAEDAAFSARACPWGPRVEFWADHAHFEDFPERRLTLEGGQAALRKRDDDWSTALKADRFVAVSSPRRITAQGKVRGWLQFKDEKKYERSAK